MGAINATTDSLGGPTSVRNYDETLCMHLHCMAIIAFIAIGRLLTMAPSQSQNIVRSCQQTSLDKVNLYFTAQLGLQNK